MLRHLRQLILLCQRLRSDNVHLVLSMRVIKQLPQDELTQKAWNLFIVLLQVVIVGFVFWTSPGGFKNLDFVSIGILVALAIALVMFLLRRSRITIDDTTGVLTTQNGPFQPATSVSIGSITSIYTVTMQQGLVRGKRLMFHTEQGEVAMPITWGPRSMVRLFAELKKINPEIGIDAIYHDAVEAYRSNPNDADVPLPTGGQDLPGVGNLIRAILIGVAAFLAIAVGIGFLIAVT